MLRTVISTVVLAGTIAASGVTGASAAGAPGAHHSVRAATARIHPAPARRYRHARQGVRLKVMSVNGTTINAINSAAVPVTVTVSTSTTILEAGTPVSITAITPNTFIVVRGQRMAAHTVAARAIRIVVPVHTGKVTAINGTTLTLTASFGTTYTVQTSSATRYVYARQPHKAATFSALKTGQRVAVQGTLSSDNSTITALRILIGPARQGNHARL